MFRSRDFEQAINEADETIRLNCQNAAAYSFRAKVWMGRKQFDLARADLDEAVRLDPGCVAFRRERSALACLLHKFDEGTADLDECIRLDPIDSENYRSRGIVRAARHDYAGARDDFDEALWLDPAAASICSDAAWLLATCPDGEYRDGPRATQLAALACELAERPKAAYYLTLGAAYAECGDFATALMCQDKAIDLDPGAGDIVMGLKAAMLYRRGRPYQQ